MQWLAEICIRRPVFAVMLVMAFVVAGIASYGQLGIDRFPRIDLPSVYVWTNYPGAASQEVESEVTQILEDAVATVAGIDELRSISTDGRSLLLLTFRIDSDIDSATQDVRDAISSVLNRLPPGIDPPVVRKQDLDASPILTLVVSGPREGRELYVLAERYVKNIIESAPGVGEVQISGASDRAVQVNIDARRLAAYRLSITQVREALVRQNAEVPGGRVDAGTREYSLRTLGRVPHSREFADLVVATVDGMPVRISDLGEAVDFQKEERTLARFDGKRAVVLQVQRQSGTNTVEVIDAVKERLGQAQAALPEDVSVQVLQDQSQYIRAAMHELQNHLISGSVLATLVVLVFMRSWRSTVIAAIAIPASIVASFAVMRALDFTLNNVTMLALVLMVGVVIDDAIVVLENVFRSIEEKGLAPREAAIEGTREIGLAVLATTLSLVIVFLPVSFLGSVTGRMLFQFGVTATAAILISMLISFSLTPMMCSRMLRSTVASSSDQPASRRGFYRWIEAGYMASLKWSMRHRVLMCLFSLLITACNIPLYHLVKQDYIPTNVDESEFEVRLTAPNGATISSMNRTLETIERDVRALPGVKHVLASIGTSGMGGVNTGTLYFRLIDADERTFSFARLLRSTLAGSPSQAFEGNFSQREKMQEVRSALGKYPDLAASIRNLTSFRQGAPVDIDFVVTGPNLDTLAKFTQGLKEDAAKIPGIVDVDITLRLDKPELLAHVDRERAAALGVDVKEVADVLRIAVGGDDRVSRYRDEGSDDAYDVELRLLQVDRRDPESISQLYVRTNLPSASIKSGEAMDSAMHDATRGDSHPVQELTRLDNLVTFEESQNISRIDRLDRQRMVAIRGNVAPGYALGDGLESLQAAAEHRGIPPGCATHVLGRGRELERTLADFGWIFLLSFVFMYIVLAAQYEHLIHPLTILLSLPLAVPFGLVSLWIGGETLNVYSALGILVLFGVVKKASILQVDHINQLRAAGVDRATAILQGNRDRLRPILMTTLAFVAGMFPLLIGTGPGAEERRSIAILAVGGQTLSLLLTLLAIPVIYSLLDDFAALFRRPQTTSVPQCESLVSTPN